jgi:lipopolysaccharide export system protein LptC
MSEAADRERVVKRGWAAPGGAHDILVRLLKIALPALAGVLVAYLALAPLAKQQESSFILDKKKVDVAREKLRVQSARYQGQDDRGRPFVIDAQSAVQPSSKQPIVDINGMSAQIQLNEGPATLRADKGRYNLEQDKVDVIGPLVFNAADGYHLVTSNVAVDLDKHQLSSGGPAQGRMRLGSFTAGHMEADLRERRVVLTGRPHLHIVQGAIR